MAKLTGQRTSYMRLAADVAQRVVTQVESAFPGAGGNTEQSDAVTRAHLWDVPELMGDPDAAVTPGMYYDTKSNLGGVGNSILEITTIPGVIMQRATGIDSGTIATRRQYGGTWSAWKTTGAGGGLSEAEVNSLITTALAAAPPAGLTEAQVKTLINTAIQNAGGTLGGSGESVPDDSPLTVGSQTARWSSSPNYTIAVNLEGGRNFEVVLAAGYGQQIYLDAASVTYLIASKDIAAKSPGDFPVFSAAQGNAWLADGTWVIVGQLAGANPRQIKGTMPIGMNQLGIMSRQNDTQATPIRAVWTFPEPVVSGGTAPATLGRELFTVAAVSSTSLTKDGNKFTYTVNDTNWPTQLDYWLLTTDPRSLSSWSEITKDDMTTKFGGHYVGKSTSTVGVAHTVTVNPLWNTGDRYVVAVDFTGSHATLGLARSIWDFTTTATGI